MIGKLTKSALMASVALGLVVPVAPAYAQSDESDNGNGGEIVVQARKRAESIMKVPVIATVIGSEKLDQYAVSDVKNIADKVPGLNYQAGNNASGTMVSLRGIGTSSNNPAIDQSVALVVDGQQFTQGLAFQASTFDMAHVEVLKGPQALFYGKAAPGGVISIRTADPTDKFEAIFRGGYEVEAQKRQFEAIFSGPVTDTLGVRLGTQYSNANGYFHNTSNPPSGPLALGALPPISGRMPNDENLIVRGTAVWKPVDSLTARLKVNYVHDDIQGWGATGQMTACPEGTATHLPVPYSPIAGDDCKLNRDWPNPTMDPASFGDGKISNNGVPFNKSDQVFGSLELNYDMGNSLTLTSLSSYYRVAQKSLGETTVSSNVGLVFALDGAWHRKDFTQELRLESDFGGPFNFTLGGFYGNGRVKYAFDLPVNLDIIALGVPLPTSLGQYSSAIDIETYSLFGQALYKLTPELELGAGARWTTETRDVVPTLVTGASYSPAGYVIPVSVNHLSPSNWSPEISLTYTPTPDFTVFANLKQAYKSGSFDLGGTIAPDSNIAFGDERVRSAELGIKSRMLDGSLRFNVAGYYEKFRGLQVQASSVLGPGAIAVRTLNAASAKVYGIDMDFAYSPPAVEGFSLYGGVNWNVAKYSDFPNAPCWWGQLQSEGCDQLLNSSTDRYTAQDLKGAKLVRAPEWSANIGFNYETAVSNEMKLRFGSNITYSSSYSTTIENFYYQDSYAKVGATIGLGNIDDRWMLELIGDNLTDKITTGSCAVQAFGDSIVFARSADTTGGTTRGPTGIGETMCYPNPGRSVLLRFTFKM